jgi:L-iditol 2-dehydrogenase
VATFNPVVVSDHSRRLFAGHEQHAPDRVIIGVAADSTAAFAERIVVPASNVVLLPRDMPIALGALIEPLAVALNAVRRVSASEGDTVLVLGGGPIGQSVVLAAQHEGVSRVYLSEPNAVRRELCASLGAIVLDPADGPIADQLIARNGSPADVAIDAVGISSTLSDALSSVSFGGRVCLVGMGMPQLTLDAYQLSTAERELTGSFCYSHDTFVDAAEWVGRGDARFSTLISAEVSLSDAPAMFERLASINDIPGKVLVRLDRR